MVALMWYNQIQKYIFVRAFLNAIIYQFVLSLGWQVSDFRINDLSS